MDAPDPDEYDKPPYFGPSDTYSLYSESGGSKTGRVNRRGGRKGKKHPLHRYKEHGRKQNRKRKNGRKQTLDDMKMAPPESKTDSNNKNKQVTVMVFILLLI